MSVTQQSVFYAKSHQSDSMLSTLSLNQLAEGGTWQVGSGTGKAPVANNPRECSMHSWHLGSPDTGLLIPKHAIIERVSLELDPEQSWSYTGLEATHRIALMAADGHWDRSRTQTLHQQQQVIDGPPGPSQYLTSYSAPSVASSIELYVDNASTEIAESITGGGAADLTTQAAEMMQTFGCTVQIPANEVIAAIRLPLSKADTPGASLDLAAQIYSLDRDSREGVPSQKVQLSSAMRYVDLPTGSPVMQTFTVSPVIPAQSTARWIAILIEGPLFNPLHAVTGTHRLTFRAKYAADHSVYPVSSLGSMLHASTSGNVQWENSFHGYYYQTGAVPMHYKHAVDAELVTPFARHFGATLNWDGVEPFTGTINVPISFGSDPSDEPLTGDIVAEVQAWIDSDDYDPSSGRYWVGMFFDQQGPVVSAYLSFKSPLAYATKSPKLTVDWHENPTIVLADSMARSRVDAPASAAGIRVQAEPRAGERVSAQMEAMQRVRPDLAEASQRVRAPHSYARSEIRRDSVEAESVALSRVEAAASQTVERVQADPETQERVLAQLEARQRVRAEVEECSQRVRAPYSYARSEKL